MSFGVLGSRRRKPLAGKIVGFDPTTGQFLQAAAGLGAFGLGQPPSTCPTTAISDASKQSYINCRAQAYSLAVSQCKDYPGAKQECVTPNFYDNFNKANCFRFCAEKCVEPGPIKAAQAELGRPVTGTWSWEDQKALEAKGLKFLDVAPGCTGAVPVATPPPPPPAPVVEPVPVTPIVVPPKRGMSTANMLAVGGVVAALAVGGYYVGKKKGWFG